MAPKKKSLFPKKPKARRRSSPRQKENTTFNLFLGFLCLLLFLALKPPSLQGPLANDSPQAFFETLAPVVQEKTRGTGLYPSLVLAQAGLESSYGKSRLACDHHNYFGIKATGREPKVTFTTSEYLEGHWQAPKEAFRAYPSPQASLQDYVDLITSFDRYQPVLQAANPQEGAWALQTSGYATDPAYASKLIRIMSDFHLSQYDP